MSYTLIIAEKPDAAFRIAQAIADKKPKKVMKNEAPYYEFTVKGKKHICVPAVGHLFVLTPSKNHNPKGWSYPIFNLEWVPTYTKKTTNWTEKYFKNIQELSKGASEFVDAADVDTEGEVLLYNILRFICGVKDAKRMKFSTLTKDELMESYKNMEKHIMFSMVESGLTRHILDALWGFNITRALTLAMKSQADRGFAILSSGRVQSPTLAILLKKELEIRKFKPKPYWQLEMKCKVDSTEMIASYEKDKIWNEKEAEKVLKSCKGKDGVIKKITKRKYKQKPPVPFNTTDLQSEAYAQFKYSPRQTLAIAEALYQAGIISYPRSSSQKLPPSINYQKILKALGKLKEYSKFVKELLAKGQLKPNEGKREDPAHPAVYPTWEVPKKKLAGPQKKLYDLIVRRFLAVFSDVATRESMKVTIDVNGNKFIVTGKRTIEPGWTEIYKPYLAFEEQLLPELKEGQKVKVIKIGKLTKETQPPGRYSQGSIIKEMEKRNIGTRCVTGDTIIPILSNHNICEVKIRELFKKEDSLDCEDERIYPNSSKMCFCVKDKNITTSRFNLVSRRKIGKNEKVYEITFEDGSKIRLTEDHPVLSYNKNSFTYLPVKQLLEGTKVVSSFLYYDKLGNTISWREFVKKLDSKSKLYGFVNLKEWRKNKGMTQKELGKILGLQQATIASWEIKRLTPLWVWSKIDLPMPKTICSTNKKIALQNPFPLVVSSTLIRILAHLIGDSSLDREKLKKKNCFDFRYTNKNLDLIKLFTADIDKIFKIDKKIKINVDKRDENKFYIRLPAVIGRILGILFEGLISKKLDIDEKFYPDFIGAIFDDEGHSNKDETKIFISNTNFHLIKNLEEYLKKLGFTPYIKEENKKYRKKNWSKSYKIFLYGRDVAKFLEIIPFFHKMKKERMIKNLTESYGRSYLLLEKKVLSSLPKNGATLKGIASITSLSLNTVKTCIKNLRKHGYVNVKVIGIRQQPRKKILYVPLKECCKTFYSFLREEVISPTLLTKTIKIIKEIDYNGYVYDITNHLTSNFILGNNVVVHNSTRAEILQTLYEREYIHGKSIEVTKLGETVAKVLKDFCPRILSEKLTRHFEEEMEKVFEGKKKREEVVKEAIKVLTKILKDFKKNEAKIGKKLLKGFVEARKNARILGTCPNCKTGELRIIYSRRTKKRFVGCSNYPKCKTAFPLPQTGNITLLNKECPECKLPMIQVWRKGKKPFRMCINHKCKTKANWGKNKKATEEKGKE